MKFNNLYNSLIQELNVAGSVSSVFGHTAGDGDTSTGWMSTDDARMPVFLGSRLQTRRKNKKKKRSRKRIKHVGEDGTIAYSKGPVQSRPPIERVFGLQEGIMSGVKKLIGGDQPDIPVDDTGSLQNTLMVNNNVKPKQSLPNDPAKNKPTTLTQREIDMIINQSVSLLDTVPGKDFNRVANKLMQQINRIKSSKKASDIKDIKN